MRRVGLEEELEDEPGIVDEKLLVNKSGSGLCDDGR